jgi:limonene 1,2-monooxygenase
MMGIEPQEQRRMMHESLDAIMRLFKAEAPVTMETDWFKLREARLQMAPYSEPHLPVFVAATFTPTGPIAAGKHGIGLLSVAGADNAAFERTWGWVEEAAAEHGQTVSRKNWRVVLNVHLAETKAQAIADVELGYKRRAYWGDRKDPNAPAANVLAGPTPPASIEEGNERGTMIVGTPDDAIAALKVLQERSGGIGGVLLFSHEWANTEATMRSYELLMRHVAPHFQGQMGPIIENRDWIEGQMRTVFGGLAPAFARAFTDHGKEPPAAIAAALEAARQRESAAAR